MSTLAAHPRDYRVLSAVRAPWGRSLLLVIGLLIAAQRLPADARPSLLLASALVGLPWVEEYFARTILQRALLARWPTWPASVNTGIASAITGLHVWARGDWHSAVPMFVVSAIAGAIHAVTGQLAPGVALRLAFHAAWLASLGADGGYP